MNDSLSQKIPNRIIGLNELAYNLWWSWHPEARDLFKSLDRPLWKVTSHNPVKLLNDIASYRLVAAAQDNEFLRKYDFVMNEYQISNYGNKDWYHLKYPSLTENAIAYFSMEFAIHNSLPLYAGGLGVLAGDYCKEASDLGVPIIGVGFMYPQGYFQQLISEDGWQEEIYKQLDFAEAPITQLLSRDKKPLKVKVDLDSREVYVEVWQVDVGRVKLYLLDTHLEENVPSDRVLSAHLYGGNSEIRLQQEIILGFGGVRVLREIGINPSIWHCNEGHTSFMMLERYREYIANGIRPNEALEKIQNTTVFTTHTPVPAGNDAFPHALMEKYFRNYWNSVGLNRDSFLKLGTLPSDSNGFNMTVLGLGMANQRNGVSQLHGAVCRRMWHGLWPEYEEGEIPIKSVTNGIHIPSWVAPQMDRLYKKHLAPDWLTRHDDPTLWEKVKDIPDEEVWEARRWLKNKLLHALQDRVRKRWSGGHSSSAQALAMGALLDVDVLTIGFCRRFTDYKRPWLILSDISRLKAILCSELTPIQIVFSGKAHPNDHQGKCLIQQVYNIARNPEFRGRIIFVEDYDLHMARYLVQGVDLWLNNPRRLQEASGTSGMKAALNGVPHLSVLDGWWYEGYNGINGWAIQDGDPNSVTDQDKTDSDRLYNLLDSVIIPLYYERDRNGIPHGWIRVIKEAIRSCVPSFSARRMLKEYVDQMYLPAASSYEDGRGEPSSLRRILDEEQEQQMEEVPSSLFPLALHPKTVSL